MPGFLTGGCWRGRRNGGGWRSEREREREEERGGGGRETETDMHMLTCRKYTLHFTWSTLCIVKVYNVEHGRAHYEIHVPLAVIVGTVFPPRIYTHTAQQPHSTPIL